MKALIQDGRIYNFVDDGYVSGNKEIDNGTHETISIKIINKFDKSINMDEVYKNITKEKGVFKFYLDSNGIVKMLDVKTQPEFIAYQKNKIKIDLTNEADPVAFQFIRGEITEQEYLDKVTEIRNRYPY